LIFRGLALFLAAWHYCSMPKRISKNLKDPNQIAAAVVALSTADENAPVDRETLSRVMAAMGRKGGKIGGKRRLVTLTPTKRRQIAKKAAEARWGKKKQK
jgi:hypothetical protein